MVIGSLNEAAEITWRCLWVGWTWFWSGVGLMVIAMGVADKNWQVPAAGVLGMVGLVALIRIGVLITSALRGVVAKPL